MIPGIIFQIISVEAHNFTAAGYGHVTQLFYVFMYVFVAYSTQEQCLTDLS